MQEARTTDRRGFTLLEILLVIGIMGVIAIFTIGISHSIRNMTKLNDTKGRMEQIAAKAREFYRAHENLPAPTGTPATKVPVEESALNMEQKFRLDAWGQYLFYNRVQNTDPIGPADGITWPINTFTLIRAVRVNGKDAAGVIISLGPNQAQDHTTTTTGLPWWVEIAYTSAGDDILTPIDVSQEAGEMAIEELKILQAKVKAFDAIYEGIDNNGIGGTDESGCVAVDDGSGAGGFTGVCPPTKNVGNDPNCGTETLDRLRVVNPSYPGCPLAIPSTGMSDGARHFIAKLYDLPNNIRLDPWLSGYPWGDGGLATIGPTDPRYHKFFSLGPNMSTATNPLAAYSLDDIVP